MAETSSLINNEEIDIRGILQFILRNKKILIFITTFGFFIGSLISLFQKNIYRGELQILLSENKNSINNINLGNSNPALNFLLRNNAGTDLKTEMELLKSPSVLMPVFELVKKEKKLKDNELSFSSWRDKNLDIKFLKGTPILQINYLDKEKNLILPVLQEISKLYQNYPDRNRVKSLKNGIKYLENQINIYQEKSKNSIKNLQEFAYQNDMPFFKSDNYKNEDIEFIRISATNEIRNIDQKLIELEKVSNSNQLKSYIGMLGNININNLNKIENKIMFAETQYKESDPSLIKLKENKEIILKAIKEETIASLKMQRINAQARKESATRPKEIINKYRLLFIKAARDKSVLERLEDSKSELSLSIAKQEKPWQLVLQPKLYSMPLSRDYLKNSILSMFLFSIGGFLYFILNELRTDLIYDENRINNDSKYKKKVLIKTDLDEIIYSKIELSLSSIVDEKDSSIGIINLSNNLNIIDNLEKYFKDVKYKNYTISNSINKIFKTKYKIIILKIKENTYKDLKIKTEQILINSEKIDFIFMYDGK